MAKVKSKKTIEKFFKNAQKYLEKIYEPDEVSEDSMYSTEKLKEITQEMLNAKQEVRTITVCAGYPEQMESEREAQLKLIIKSNNLGTLCTPAVIQFLDSLYDTYGHSFVDIISSFQGALDQVYNESRNSELIGLINEFLPQEA